MNGIIISNLAIGYKKKVVAKGLSATICGGGLTCLIGRNGLGKSTLLRTLAGFQPALGGSITIRITDEGVVEKDGEAGERLNVKDYDVASVSKATMSRLVAEVLTEKVDIVNMTVFDIVAMGRMPYTNFFGTLKDEDRKNVEEAMRTVGIAEFAMRDISTLSDGERQKVMIAKALAQQTPVIILDEPTAFLDYPSKVETLRLLGRLAHHTGKIIVLSTHDLNLAVHLADHLVTFGNGLEEVGKDRLRRYLDQLLESQHASLDEVMG